MNFTKMLDNKTLRVYTYIIRQGKAFKTRKGTKYERNKKLMGTGNFRRNA